MTRRPRSAKRGGGLQQQRRFADAGIAADQHRRARHEAAAEHAVELGNAGRQRAALRGAAGKRLEATSRPLRALCATGAGRPDGGGLLDDGVPLAAGRAFAGPARGHRAAGSGRRMALEALAMASGFSRRYSAAIEAAAETGEHLVADGAGVVGQGVDGDVGRRSARPRRRAGRARRARRSRPR